MLLYGAEGTTIGLVWVGIVPEDQKSKALIFYAGWQEAKQRKSCIKDSGAWIWGADNFEQTWGHKTIFFFFFGDDMLLLAACDSGHL